METKICIKCNLELPATTKYFKLNKDKRRKKVYLTGRCRICIRKDQKIYRDSRTKDQRERARKNALKYYYTEKGKENAKKFSKTIKFKQSQKKYRNTNKGKITSKKAQTKSNYKARINLNDRYIKGQLSTRLKVKPSDIPDDFIEIKRQQLLLHREIKKLES